MGTKVGQGRSRRFLGLVGGLSGGNEVAMVVPFPPRSRYPAFMPRLFDPLAWLRSEIVTVNLKPDGEIELLFDEYTRCAGTA